MTFQETITELSISASGGSARPRPAKVRANSWSHILSLTEIRKGLILPTVSPWAVAGVQVGSF